MPKQIQVSDALLTVELNDGRTLSVPLAWYPRLSYGEPAERNDFELIGNGLGIHWPQLDEDISIQNLLEGRRSNESLASIHKWLAKRRQTTGPTNY